MHTQGMSIEFIRCAARGCERHHRRGLFRVASLFTGLCSNIHACYLLHLMHNCDRTLATCVCFLLLHVSQLCISSHSRRKKRGEQGPHHLHTLTHPPTHGANLLLHHCLSMRRAILIIQIGEEGPHHSLARPPTHPSTQTPCRPISAAHGANLLLHHCLSYAMQFCASRTKSSKRRRRVASARSWPPPISALWMAPMNFCRY